MSPPLKIGTSVGAGTAGSVLAAELSSNPDVKVLLIEAGGHESWISRVPLLAPMQMIVDSTWNYQTVPQSHSHVGFHDQVENTSAHNSKLLHMGSLQSDILFQISSVPRGKFLGGTGNMNFYIHNVSSAEANPILASALETSCQRFLFNAVS